MADINSQGLTPAQMSQLAEQGMKDRVAAQSVANPNVLVQGAPMGVVGNTPTTFQAYTSNNPVVQPPQGLNYYDPVSGKTVQGDINADRPWEKYGLGSANAMYNMDPRTLKALEAQKNGTPAQVTTPTTTTSVPGGKSTVSGDVGNADVRAQDEGLATRQNQLEVEKQQRIAQLETDQKQEEDNIRQVFQDRRNELGAQNQEQQLTQDTLSYRLGRKDTPYGVAEMSKLKNDQARVMNELSTQEVQLIGQSRAALRKGEFDVAAQIQDRADKMFQQRIQLEQLNFQKQSQIREEQKYVSQFGKEAISNMAAAGMEPSQELFDWYDSNIGVQGVGQSIYGAALQEQQRQSIKDSREQQAAALNTTKTVFDLLDRVPAGTAVKIGSSTYFGTQGTGKVEIDENGVGRMAYVDQSTGEIAVKQLGKIGKVDPDSLEHVFVNGVEMIRNKKTDVITPLVTTGGASGDASWTQSVCPDGTVGGQCGEFIHNFVADYPYGVNTVAQRAAIVNVPKTEKPQVGDVVLQNYGTTGHSALVNWVGQGPDGKDLVKLTESNFNGDEKVTNTRTVSTVDPSILGYFRGTLKPLAVTGSGTPTPAAQPASSVPPSPFFSGTMTADQYRQAQEKENNAVISAQELKNGSLDIKDIDASIRPRAAQLARAQGWKSVDEKTINAPSFEEFAKNYEQASLKDPNKRMITPDEVQNAYNMTVGLNGPIMDAAQNLSYKLSDKKAPQVVADIRSALESGDYARAKDKIMKAALDTADTGTTQQVRGRDASIRALDGIQSALQDYVRKNGDTGVFSGSFEQMIQKVGYVSDPELRGLATRIKGALIDYRRAVSGAAFTESEKTEYDQIFPSIMNKEALNDANINALKYSFAQGNESFYRQQLGNENYDAIFGGK